MIGTFRIDWDYDEDGVLHKVCSLCGLWYPATTEFFHIAKSYKDLYPDDHPWLPNQPRLRGQHKLCRNNTNASRRAGRQQINNRMAVAGPGFQKWVTR